MYVCIVHIYICVYIYEYLNIYINIHIYIFVYTYSINACNHNDEANLRFSWVKGVVAQDSQRDFWCNCVHVGALTLSSSRVWSLLNCRAFLGCVCEDIVSKTPLCSRGKDTSLEYLNWFRYVVVFLIFGTLSTLSLHLVLATSCALVRNFANFFGSFFVDFWKKILGLEKTNSWKYGISKNCLLHDRETQYFEAVSSRGKQNIVWKYLQNIVIGLYAVCGYLLDNFGLEPCTHSPTTTQTKKQTCSTRSNAMTVRTIIRREPCLSKSS